MAKDYKEITSHISKYVAELSKAIPDTMAGFRSMSSAATRTGALTLKHKELIALALGVATRCDGCIGFHTRTLVREGVSREEFAEALGMAVYMGGGPSLMYAAEALHAFEQFSEQQIAR